MLVFYGKGENLFRLACSGAYPLSPENLNTPLLLIGVARVSPLSALATELAYWLTGLLARALALLALVRARLGYSAALPALQGFPAAS